MGRSERKAYLAAIRARYYRANKAAKGLILDEFCAVCGYHRKYALRCLNQQSRLPRPPKRRAGRPSKYDDPAILKPLRVIWLATDQIASKRLKVAIPLWLPHYEAAHGPVQTQARARLLEMSPATIDRLLTKIRMRYGNKGKSGTKPGTLIKRQIPIQGGVWDISQPGFVEADTVAHCGASLAGEFVWSLTMTDIYSGWTECRATWNKGATGVLEQIKSIQSALPFELRGFDCDNGGEFLNWHLVHYSQGLPRVKLTRSRPYRSNDNAHVEQKNWTHVRQIFGYDRLEQRSMVKSMNDLYANDFSLLHNYFCPTMKLATKKRDGSRMVKAYHAPQTPAQRLLDHPDVPEPTKQALRATLASLNPFELQQGIQRKLRKILQQALVTPDSESTYQPLGNVPL
jgi:hypothetical protein